jgi:hypothetical protein
VNFGVPATGVAGEADGTVVVVVVAGELAAQVGGVKVSLFKVTAPLRARARPWTVTLLFTVIELRARMLPVKVEPVPSVAELPTCQNTLHAFAPLINVTVLPDPVVSDELVWKMNTEFALPAPSSVNGPVRLNAPLPGPAYTPACRCLLARSAVVVASTDRPAAFTYAAVRSDWAWAAAATRQT